MKQPRARQPRPEPVPAVGELKEGLLAGFVGPKVRILWNLLSARMNVALAPYRLRPGAFSALGIISANPGCSQNELAASLGIDKSAVVALIDDFEERGLARRERSPLDRRRHTLWLTPEGDRLMIEMLPPVSQAGLAIREELSPQELEQLLALLTRACRALS